MSFDCKQFTHFIIEPALHAIGMFSPAAVKLLQLTMAQESDFGHHVVQLYGGPALGVYQMEPVTYQSIVEYMIRKPELLKKILYTCYMNEIPNQDALIWNLMYATICARLRYWWVKNPLPDENDLQGLAEYYKSYYNTATGASNTQDAIRNYLKYCT